MRIKYLLLIIILLFPTLLFAKDRCRDFIPDIRAASIRYLGLSYPWWYNVGCAMAESNCRADIVSFDGGKGLYQFTESTGVVAEIKKDMPINPSNAESSIKAEAFYMNKIINTYLKRPEFKFKGKEKYRIDPSYFTKKCGTRLSDAYRHYNGGAWFIYESKLDGYTCDKDSMREHCVRGGAWVPNEKAKNRRWLSFCDVNYSYPDKIFKFSKPYKVGKDGMNYW